MSGEIKRYNGLSYPYSRHKDGRTPEWAKKALAEIKEQRKKKKDREER